MLMTARVLVSDRLSETAVQIFRDRGLAVDYEPELGADKEALLARIGDYDGLAIRSTTKVTDKLRGRADRLKAVGRAGIGIDNVELAAATSRGIVVMNTPFGNAITTAEHTVALMMALARQIPEADHSMQDRQVAEEPLHRASSSTARRSASSAAAISARSSPSGRSGSE